MCQCELSGRCPKSARDEPLACFTRGFGIIACSCGVGRHVLVMWLGTSWEWAFWGNTRVGISVIVGFGGWGVPVRRLAFLSFECRRNCDNTYLTPTRRQRQCYYSILNDECAFLCGTAMIYNRRSLSILQLRSCGWLGGGTQDQCFPVRPMVVAPFTTGSTVLRLEGGGGESRHDASGDLLVVAEFRVFFFFCLGLSEISESRREQKRRVSERTNRWFLPLCASLVYGGVPSWGWFLCRQASHGCYCKRVRMCMWPALARISALYIVVACVCMKRARARRSGPAADPCRDRPPPPSVTLVSTAPIEANSPRFAIAGVYFLAVLG